MSKNAIIALVIGLIIGGLVIFLVMGFTDAGQTMIISWSGGKSETSSKSTPSSKVGEISANYDFRVPNVKTPDIVTEDGKILSVTVTVEGDFAIDGDSKIAMIKHSIITDASEDTKEWEKETNPETLSAQTESLKGTKVSAANFDAIERFSESGTPGAELASVATLADETFNSVGTSPTAMDNKARLATTAEDFTNRIKTETGADDWDVSANSTISYSSELESELIAEMEANGIEYADGWGWAGKKAHAIWAWCSDKWDRFKAGWDSYGQ